MTLSTEGARGARQSVFTTVTLICDNDQGAYNALTGVARDVLTSHEGLTLAAYRELHAFPAGEHPWALAGAAGEACAEVVREWVDEVSGLPSLLLADLLDFGDAQLWAEIGWHYLPEPDDVAAEDFDGFEVEA
jgi:hypothetical protein